MHVSLREKSKDIIDCPVNLMNKKLRSGSALKIISLAKPYIGFIILVFFISLATNGLSLAVPKIMASTIDTFRKENFNLSASLTILSIITLFIFIFSMAQSFLQTYLSEKIGRDLRNRLIQKISTQPFSFINQITPEKLLTNLTGDIDNLKQVIALGLVQVFSSSIESGY